ncbi:TPA: BppU family phage baseplate upper protein, partial [Enterococcus faecium]
MFKINESIIVIQAEATNPNNTDVVFWSHDRGTAKLRMKLVRKNGIPQSLPEGTTVPIRLMFRSATAEGGYGKHDYLATIEDRVNGIVLEADNENFLTDNESYIVFLLKKINERDSPSPYDLLTTYIFENDIDNAEELIALFDFSEEIFKNNVESYNDYGNVEHFFDSIRRHVNLAVIQQKHIVASSKEALKISEEAEKNINQTEEKIKKLEKNLNKAEQTIENMEKIKGSIYTEFIAILGIFSALIFGLFGGFDGLSKAIVSLSSKWSMGKVLTISSGIMLCLTLLIFALLQWVARITGRKLTS